MVEQALKIISGCGTINKDGKKSSQNGRDSVIKSF
jgi:hypothetical protein